MKTQDFVTSNADVNSLVRLVLQSDHASAAGRATYLRSLLASLQIELGEKPIVAQPRGRVRKPEKEAALKALEAVNGRFYPLVLAAIDEDGTADALDRNSRSGFARSAVSTLRTAIALGINPLSLVIGKTSKVYLSGWIEKHRPAPGPVRLSVGIKRVTTMVADFSAMLGRMSNTDRAAVVTQLQDALVKAKLLEVPVAHGRPRVPARGGRQAVEVAH